MDFQQIAEAIASSKDTPALKRRMGVVSAINSNYTINVTIAGSTTVISNVRYFAHFAPKVGSQVWLDTDGKDWIAVGSIAGLGAQVPSVKVYRNAHYTVASGATWTSVPWNVAEFDPYGMYSANSEKITAPITGRYLITGQVTWTGNATGYRAGQLVHSNGSTPFAYTQVDAGTTNQFSLSVSSIHDAVAGEWFYLQARQGSGANLDLLSTTTQLTQMSVTYLGPGV